MKPVPAQEELCRLDNVAAAPRMLWRHPLQSRSRRKATGSPRLSRQRHRLQMLQEESTRPLKMSSQGFQTTDGLSEFLQGLEIDQQKTAGNLRKLIMKWNQNISQTNLVVFIETDKTGLMRFLPPEHYTNVNFDEIRNICQRRLEIVLNLAV